MDDDLDLDDVPESGAISEEVLARETAMCRKLNRENGGRCNWGKCESCGVIPLLYKLSGGGFLETAESVEKAKSDIFNG